MWAMLAYGLGKTQLSSTRLHFDSLFLRREVTITGLLVTYIALNVMDGHGQPALLYIVPFTLGTKLASLCCIFSV